MFNHLENNKNRKSWSWYCHLLKLQPWPQRCHHQVVDLQDQQEDRLAHRVDGGGEGALEDLPALPTYVLATGIQGELHHPSCSSHRYHPDVWTSKVPTSTNALVELMNMVERWRQRTDYGPVVVVSQDGISRCFWSAEKNSKGWELWWKFQLGWFWFVLSRCGVYCAANACIEQVHILALGFAIYIAGVCQKSNFLLIKSDLL